MFTAPRQPSAAWLARTFSDLKATLAIYPITADTAELAGKIHAESARQGVVIPFDDLLIGACALERGYAIATRNHRHFQRIPGPKLVPF